MHVWLQPFLSFRGFFKIEFSVVKIEQVHKSLGEPLKIEHTESLSLKQPGCQTVQLFI